MAYSNKKAQGISINVIIIAALALAVLVVLFAIFTGRLGIFSKALDSCTNLGGTCKASCSSGTETEYIAQRTDCGKDKNMESPKCCIPVPGT